MVGKENGKQAPTLGQGERPMKIMSGVNDGGTHAHSMQIVFPPALGINRLDLKSE